MLNALKANLLMQYGVELFDTLNPLIELRLILAFTFCAFLPSLIACGRINFKACFATRNGLSNLVLITSIFA
ncbi:hypothetical protein ABC405_000769 [Campylobacter fetus]